MGRLSKGLVEVYTGDGKGKTTAALGLGLRALGHGSKVYMIQFMKGNIEYGEIIQSRKMENFIIRQFGRQTFVDKTNPAKVDIELAQNALNHAIEITNKGEFDIVILDEINVALEWGLIGLGDVLKLIEKKPEHVELILTGRYAPKEITDVADLVTEMKEIKHPYHQGEKVREGIEY
jgi:cob(I)alamin adenosyltransferase